MNHIGLFEGIGGFSLAARWIGWNTVAWCEWDSFCQTVLKYHYPEAEGHGDITKTDFTKYANRIDILTGGFPCQPFSVAGERKGTEDSRYLWPEMLRTIREIQPRYIVGENVLGLVSWSKGLVFEQVQNDLETQGYEVFPVLLPACAVNSPQQRGRVWFVAYSNKVSRNTMDFGYRKDTQFRKEEEWCKNRNEFQLDFNGTSFEIREEGGQKIICESPLIGNLNGFSEQLDGITFQNWCNKSNGAYGNAVVPQLVLQIFKAIEQYELTLT